MSLDLDNAHRASTFGFYFSEQFADREPYLLEMEARVVVGRDWLRLNMPYEWARYCAMRILGQENRLSEDDWMMVCEEAKNAVGFSASNSDLATVILRRWFTVIAERSWIEFEKIRGVEHASHLDR